MSAKGEFKEVFCPECRKVIGYTKKVRLIDGVLCERCCQRLIQEECLLEFIENLSLDAKIIGSIHFAPSGANREDKVTSLGFQPKGLHNISGHSADLKLIRTLDQIGAKWSRENSTRSGYDFTYEMTLKQAFQLVDEFGWVDGVGHDLYQSIARLLDSDYDINMDDIRIITKLEKLHKSNA
jgi:hypothetical protein